MKTRRFITNIPGEDKINNGEHCSKNATPTTFITRNNQMDKWMGQDTQTNAGRILPATGKKLITMKIKNKCPREESRKKPKRKRYVLKKMEVTGGNKTKKGNCTKSLLYVRNSEHMYFVNTHMVRLYTKSRILINNLPSIYELLYKTLYAGKQNRKLKALI